MRDRSKYRAYDREYLRKWRARIKADPKKHQEYLEKQRTYSRKRYGYAAKSPSLCTVRKSYYERLRQDPVRWAKRLARARVYEKKKYWENIVDPEYREKRLQWRLSSRDTRIRWQRIARYGELYEALEPLLELKKELRRNHVK